MKPSIKRFSVRTLALGAAMFGSAAVFADISHVVFEITATNSLGTATWQATEDQGVWLNPTTFRWQGGGVALTDGEGDEIAFLNSAAFMAVEDPVVTLIFDVQAGGFDTNFTITSGLVSFPTLASGVTGSATAGITVTDSGQDNGAILTGTGGSTGGFGWQSNYNGLAPAGTIFAEGLPGVSTATPGGSNVANTSTGGFQPIAGPVSSISSQFNFLLSATDSASGTSAFIVVPEPASLLLVLGGFMLVRRR